MEFSAQLSQIGTNIKSARSDAGMELSELAKLADILPTRLLEFEKSAAMPDLTQLERIASTLHIPLARLLDMDAKRQDAEEAEAPKPHIRTCRHAFPNLDGSTKCRNYEATGHEETCREQCEVCPAYSSMYIQYPLEIQGIVTEPIEGWNLKAVGDLVAVRPCSENPENKTYLGLYLGEQPWFLTISFHPDDQKLHAGAACNPLIYVFETKRLVRGADSWWGRINSPDDLKQISDRDIQSTWYVKLLNDMANTGKGSN